MDPSRLWSFLFPSLEEEPDNGPIQPAPAFPWTVLRSYVTHRTYEICKFDSPRTHLGEMGEAISLIGDRFGIDESDRANNAIILLARKKVCIIAMGAYQYYAMYDPVQGIHSLDPARVKDAAFIKEILSASHSGDGNRKRRRLK